MTHGRPASARHASPGLPHTLTPPHPRRRRPGGLVPPPLHLHAADFVQAQGRVVLQAVARPVLRTGRPL